MRTPIETAFHIGLRSAKLQLRLAMNNSAASGRSIKYRIFFKFRRKLRGIKLCISRIFGTKSQGQKAPITLKSHFFES